MSQQGANGNSSSGGANGKLKILMSLLYYFPHRTGLTIHVQSVAEELVRRGHEVTVLTARYNQSLPRDTVMHNGVRVVRLWTPPVTLSRGMVMPAFPWAALGLMMQHDVISIHTPMLETAMISVLAGIAGKTVICTHHGDLILPQGGMNRVISGLMHQFFNFMARRAGRLIAYSQDYADHSYYLKPFLDKVTPVYPPIQMPPPNPQRAEELHEKWSHEGGPVIGFAGRFVEEKRPDLLIKALEVINQTYPNARVVFAGEYDIPYETFWQRNQDIVAKYRDQLTFLGLMTDTQDMADFYAACDVLALTSDTECFALVQVEAMLCGTPVVMTNTPGGRVPVQVTGMGKIAEVGDWRSIGQALVDVLNDTSHYQRPREVIEQQFSFTETVDRYEQILYQYADVDHERSQQPQPHNAS